MTDIGTIRGALTLEDLTSQPSDRARDALGRFAKAGDDLSRKLGSTVDPALSRSGKSLEAYAKQAERTGRQLQSLGTSLSTSITLPILALGGSVIKAGSDFESSFAGVRKTVNATEKEFAALSASLRELAAGDNAVPIDVNKLNAVAEAAGQLGIAKGDIIAFTRSMADLGETTNLTADEAATATAQFQNIFGAAGKEVDRFGSTLVALGNAGASTEKQILEMGMRIASAGNQIGLTQGEVLAFASSLASVGIEAEAGGSAISKIMIEIALAVSKGGKELDNFASIAGMSSADFQKAFKDDAAAAITEFVEGLGGLKESGGDLIKVLDQMGITEVRMGNALRSLAGSGDLLDDSLKLQAKAWRENTALATEAAERYKTFESQLQIFWNRLKDVGITLGTSLLPILQDFLITTKPIIGQVAVLAEKFAALPKSVQAGILVFAGLAAAVGPVVFVAGQLVTAWGAIAAILPTVGGAIGSVVAVLSGPVGWIAAGVALLVAWKPTRDFLVEFGSAVLGAFTSAVKEVISVGKMWWDSVEDIRKPIGQLIGVVGQLTTDTLGSFMSVVKDTIKTISDWWHETEDARRFTFELAKVIRQDLYSVLGDIADRVETVIGWYVDYTDWVIKLSTSISDSVVEFLEWSGVLPAARAAIDLVTDGLKLFWGWIVKAKNKLLEWVEIAGGWANVLSVVNPALGASVRIMSDWADRARKGADAGKDVVKTKKEIAAATDEETKKEEEGTKPKKKTIGLTDELTKSQLAAAKALAELRAQLESNTSQALEMASALESGVDSEHLAAIERAHALHNSWLADVAQFGKAAADALKSLRAAEYDAIEAAEKEAKIWALAETVRNRVLAPLPSDNPWDVFADNGILDAFNRLLADQQQVLEEINGEHNRQARSIDAANALLAQGVITQEQLNEYMRQYSDMWEVLPAQLSLSEELLLSMGDSLLSAADAGITALADGIVEAAFEGGEAWEDLGKSIESILKRLIADWLAQWFRAMAQWLARWIATQVAAKAAQKGLGDSKGGDSSTQAQDAAKDLSKASGATAGILGTAAVFAAIYIGVSAWIKSHKEYAAEVTFKLHKDADAVVNDVNGYTRQARGLTDSVKQAGEMVKDFLFGLGGVLEGFSAEVTIGSKGRGKNTQFFVQLEDGVKEWFGKYEDALEFAIVKAIESSEVRGFSPLMQQGLSNADFSSLDELGSFLGDLQAITQLNWSDSARQIASTTAEVFRLWDALRDVKIVTPEVEGSLAALGGLIVNSFQDWSDKLTGRVKTPAEAEAALKREGELYNAQLKLQIAQIHMRESDLEMERHALENRIKIIQGRGRADRAEIEIGVKFLNYRADQIKTEMSLEEQRLAFIDAELKALADILAALPALLDVNSLKLPKLGRGVGGSDKDAVRDFIKDTKFDIYLRGLSDYKRSLAELDKIYDEQLEKAGKDKKLRAELLALKEKELQLLRQEEAKSTLANFNEFMGLVTPFDAVRKTAADLIKQIEESPFGDARKARMIGRVLAEVERQIERMAQQSALSLFGEMLGDLEKFGADEQLMMDVRRQMAILEHTLKMAHFRAEFEILKAQGKLSAETIAVMEAALNFLEGVDPLSILGPPANDNEAPRRSMEERRKAANDAASQAAKKLADELSRAADLLKKYEDDELSDLDRRKREIIDDFTIIRKAFGDTPAVMSAFNNAIRKATEEAYESLRQFYESLNGTGANSNLTTEQQFEAARSQLDATLAAIAGGDTSKLDLAAEQGQTFIDLLGEMFGTSTEGFTTEKAALEKRLADLFASAGLDMPQVASPASLSSPASIAAETQAQMREGTQQIVSASERIAEVIDIRGKNNERLLQSVSTVLSEILATLEQANRQQPDKLSFG